MERYFPGNYFSALSWGLAVLLGMIGWGRLAARAIGGREASEAGWGLHAVWGMAVYLFVGGCLAVVHAGTDLGITLLILAGLANWLWTTARGGWPTRAALAAWPWFTWPAFALVALSFAAAIGWQANLNYCDDLGAYFGFCEKLLVTGTFDEPFSWRRLASLGGQTMLLGSTLANTSYCDALLFEIGLCPVILLGLIVGFRGGALVRTPFGIFLALVAVTAPILRFNTASHATSIVLFMGLFVTLDGLERVERRRNWLLTVGVVAAALCTLRAQSLAAAGITLAVYWILWWLRDRPSFRRVFIDGCWCCGALLLALAPWSYMSYRSNQSPLFSLVLGGHSLAFNPMGFGGTFYQKLGLVVELMVVPTLAPLLLSLLILPSWKKVLASWAVAISAVATSMILAYGVGPVPDDTTVPRYVQPLLLTGAFSVVAAGALVPRLHLWVGVLLTIFLLSDLDRRGLDFLARYEALGTTGKNLLPSRPQVIADYRKAQLLVPEGQRVLLAADFPFLFDHARNDLWNVDLPHAASPSPGLPYHQPPEETKRYLRRLGIEYLIYANFDQGPGILVRPTWQNLADSKIELFRIQEPFYIDFFDTVESLAASEIVLGRAGNLTVVQLKP